MLLQVINHEKIVFEGEVDAVYTKGVDGAFGILPHHIPITSALDIGVTKFVKNGVETFMTTMGGVLQFKDEKVTILTDFAEMGKDIDVARAHAAKERALNKINTSKSKDEILRAQIALSKALARLKASGKV